MDNISSPRHIPKALEKALYRKLEILDAAAVFGNSAEFWLNIHHAVELWDVRNNVYQKEAEGIQALPFNREVVLGAV